VDALVKLLGLDPTKRAKVKRYYHELESGLLEPRGVDRRVWEALAETLKAQVVDLVGWRPRGVEPLGGVYLRRAEASAEFSLVIAPRRNPRTRWTGSFVGLLNERFRLTNRPSGLLHFRQHLSIFDVAR
jgi:hypothetical protein